MGVSRKRDWLDYARMASGLLCVTSGIAKAFPRIEDVAHVLSQMAVANAGTVLTPFSDFIAANAKLTTGFVGLALVGSGLAFLSNRLLIPAALGQLVMFVCFVTMLFRFQPAIIVVDLPFIAVAALVLRRELARQPTPNISGEVC